MPITLHCGTCGAALLEGAPGGQCPECLLQLGLAAGVPEHSDTPGGKNLPPLRSFGDYELIEEIARGGMGVVFKARQISLNRVVAVKMILAGHFAGPDSVRRFRTEAEATARLRHPNIVAIHEIGEHDGQQFFSMDYIEGHNLAEAVREKPMAAKRAAALLQRVAEAIHYAHGQGLLHRDLKPSNILLDADDQPHVTDFGLAKRLDSDSDLITGHWSVTVTGQVIGSPNYISPEQASGRRRTIGPTTDVYALGAVLCHLLTGRAPFIGETLTDILEQVLHKDPVSPRLLNPAVPRDLETICLKCLQKEPDRRYATAQELADELDRFLKGEPILARPVSRVEKAWRWCRRKPALAGLCAATVVLLLAVAIGSPIAAYRINRSREQAVQAGRQTQRNLVAQYVANGTRLMNDGDLFGSLLWYAEALWLDAGPPEREEPHRIRIASLLRECPRLLNVFAHGTAIHHAEFSPDGSRLVTASDDHTARVWDVVTGQLVHVLSHQDQVYYAAFSPDSLRVVTASSDGTARVWDAATGLPIGSPLRHSNSVWHAEFSPDGRRIATASEDRTVKVWDSRSGELAAPPLLLSNAAARATFSPDGRSLLVAANYNASVWEVATGRLKFPPLVCSGGLAATSFSPDGSRLLTHMASEASMWDTRTGERLAWQVSTDDWQDVATFAPDGNSVLICDRKGGASVWDAQSGRPLVVPLKVASDNDGGVSPDGHYLVTGGRDTLARVWSAHSGRPISPVLKHPSVVRRVQFASDSHRFLTLAGDQRVCLWDLVNLGRLRPLPRPPSAVERRFISPDGGRILLPGEGNALVLHDIITGRDLSVPMPHPQPISDTWFSPDGQVILTVCSGQNTVLRTERTLSLWDTTGKRLNQAEMKIHSGVSCAAFSPGLRHLVTGGYAVAHLWEIPSGRLLAEMQHGARVSFVAYSADGRRILACCDDRTASVWDAVSAQPLSSPLYHLHPVCQAFLSANGRRLHTVTVSDKVRVQAWDWAAGEPLTLPCETGDDGDGPAAELWNLRPDTRPVGDLVLLARMLAARGLDRNGVTGPLPVAELSNAWRVLKAKYPAQFATSRAEEAEWHRAELETAEAWGYPTRALFHVNRLLNMGSPIPEHAGYFLRKREYLLAGDDKQARKSSMVRRVGPRDLRAGPQLIDLSDLATFPLRDGDDIGEDFGELNPGLVKLGGVAFDARGGIMLARLTGSNEKKPRAVTIPVGQKCQRLHFLHTTAWEVPNGTRIGCYVLRYADGKHAELPIIFGRHVSLGWFKSGATMYLPEGKVVWTGSSPAARIAGYAKRLCLSTRENPRPEVEVVSIDFVSDLSTSSPVLIALTVE